MGTQLEKIQAAVITLMRDKGRVFYASLILQMIRIADEGCPTIGVSLQNGRIYLYYNPKFIDQMSIGELVAIMEHEVLHLVMDHLFRIKNRHPRIWNVAADMAINQMIEGLPKKWKNVDGEEVESISHEKFGLPPKKAAEQYYNLLQKNKQMGDGTGPGGSGSGKGKGKGQPDPNGKGNYNGAFDDHSKWGNSKGDMSEELQKEIIKQAIKDAYSEAQKSRGHLPGNVEEMIKEWLRPPEIPWQQVLRQYVGHTIKTCMKSSWRKTNRRMGEGFKGRVPIRTIKIGIAIDTSGSVGTNEFQEFIAEMRGIQKCYRSEITIMECDAAVQKTYVLKPFGKVDTKFAGRGGTDFNPVFKEIRKNPKLKPEALIYFTDMYCDFPKEIPRFPVIWVVTSTGAHDAIPPFGRVVHIKKRCSTKPGEDDD